MKPSDNAAVKPGTPEKDAPYALATKTSGRDAEARKLSRVERLRRKVRKLQGKNPDIYPMW